VNILLAFDTTQIQYFLLSLGLGGLVRKFVWGLSVPLKLQHAATNIEMPWGCRKT